MRALVVVSIGAALVGSFFLGRLSKPAPAAPASDRKALTATEGDVIRIPGIATRCVASEEGGFPNMLCDHTPRGRYEVVIFGDELLVYRNGDPDHPHFTARWKP